MSAPARAGRLLQAGSISQGRRPRQASPVRATRVVPPQGALRCMTQASTPLPAAPHGTPGEVWTPTETPGSLSPLEAAWAVRSIRPRRCRPQTNRTPSWCASLLSLRIVAACAFPAAGSHLRGVSSPLQTVPLALFLPSASIKSHSSTPLIKPPSYSSFPHPPIRTISLPRAASRPPPRPRRGRSRPNAAPLTDPSQASIRGSSASPGAPTA